MSRYLPVVLGVLAIVGLTIPQIRMTDRFAGTNITAFQRAELLQNVPRVVGNWHGEDMSVDDAVRDTAGAVGAISRVYRNVRTGEVVDLWLIVGHGRVISAHTPNICYRASGFEMRAPESSLYPMVLPGQLEAPFLTNTFFKEDVTGRRLVRVFWSWYNPETDEDLSTVEWEAPSNARWHFGNTRALYKMYFTSEMRDSMETAEQSACLHFASEFLPVVNKALAVVYGDVKPSEVAEAKAEPAPKAETAESDSAALETVDEQPAEPQALEAEPKAAEKTE
ncbi:MAG: exosortase-associated EpsI family protein [Pirellulales bacterium]